MAGEREGERDLSLLLRLLLRSAHVDSALLLLLQLLLPSPSLSLLSSATPSLPPLQLCMFVSGNQH